MAFTHIAAGAAAAIGVSTWLGASIEQSVLVIGGGVLGSMLPDIDHPQSAFGRRAQPVSTLISAIFGHRGITHSLGAVLIVSLLAWIAFTRLRWHPGYSIPFVIGIAAGYLSHLVGDWFTNSGVPLLWPSKRRFVSPIRLFTGDFKEYVLAFVIYGWVIFYMATKFGRT